MNTTLLRVTEPLATRHQGNVGARIGDVSTIWILLGIVFVGFLFRLIAFQGFMANDDATYIVDANMLAHGHFAHATHWDLRVALIAPVALSIHLFGVHDWSVALYPMCLALLSLPLVYLLGAQLFDRRVGLLAALLLACWPQHIIDSSLIFPELPGAFWGSVGVLLALMAARSRERASRGLFALACGVSVGIAYLTWEPNPLFVPVCLAMLRFNRPWPRLSSASCIVLVLTAFVCIESLVYWKIAGNPWLRVTVVHHREAIGQHPTNWIGLLTHWPALLLNPGYPSVFLYTVLMIWALVVRWRTWQNWPARQSIAWLGGMLCIYIFVPSSVHPLIPAFEANPRYLENVAFPLVLLIAGAICSLYPGSRDVTSELQA